MLKRRYVHESAEGISAKLRAARELGATLVSREDAESIALDPSIHSIREMGRTMVQTGEICGLYCQDYVDDCIDSGIDAGSIKGQEQIAKWYLDDINKNNYMGFTREGLCFVDMM